MVNHQNNFGTNLTSAVSASDTTSPLNSIPTVAAPFYLAFDATNVNNHYEIVYVTSKTATNVNHAALSYDHTTDEEVRMVVPAVEMDALWDGLAGWTSTAVTLTYSSADDPTYVVSTASDLTGSISVGMKMKFTNNSTTFYGIVTAITSGTITLYGGTDYDVANSAITAVYYSSHKAPLGFPMDPTKWTVITSDTSDRSVSCSATTWTNINSAHNIIIPIGVWDFEYDVDGFADRTTAGTGDGGTVTYSTANNSESDQQLTSFVGYYGSAVANTSDIIGGHAHRRKTLVLASKTTYYLNAYMQNAGTFYVNAGQTYGGATVAKAVCAYL